MIKHKRYIKQNNYFINGLRLNSEEKEYYLCNQAVKPNKEKLVDKWKEVTCKNCLKIRKSILKEYSLS